MRHGRRHEMVTVTRAAAWTLCLALSAAARGEEAATVKAAASGTAGTVQPGGPVPFWQAPALPTAVIQGGAIPAGWQPQAVPYQGIGPDGRPMTMYFAPTYVFTYQAGPPVLAAPAVNRRPPAAPASGWNFASQGAPAVPMTLPPATVSRYQPIPYQFPPDARALTGTPIAPPSTPLPGPPPAAAVPSGFAPAAAPPPPIPAPPQQWVPSNVAPPPGVVPQQGVMPQQGLAPQQGVTSQSGFVPQPGPPPQQGFVPQQGFAPQPGPPPQQGFVPQQGVAPQADAGTWR